MSARKTLVCPECGYASVYNGRGTCRCGAHLVWRWAGMSRKAQLIVTAPERTWFYRDKTWTRFTELEAQE